MHCGLSTAWICGHNRLPRISPLREGCSRSARWLRLPTRAEPAVGSTCQTSGWHAFPGRADAGEPRGARPRTSRFFGHPLPGLPRGLALGTVHSLPACAEFLLSLTSPSPPSPPGGTAGRQGCQEHHSELEGARGRLPLNSSAGQPRSPTSESCSPATQCCPSELLRECFFLLLG